MKYYLSIEFESKGEPKVYVVGDTIAFISFRGNLKVGTIEDIKCMKGYPNLPSEYSVRCGGKLFIADVDYVIKSNSKVLNLKSTISQVDNGFPLRT